MPTSSVLSRKIKQDVTLHPNPAKGLITLSFGPTPIKQTFLEIFNTEGKQIISEIFTNSTSLSFDLTGYPKGLYMVKVIADGLNYEKKAIIE
jgi:hypothetical protein